MISGGGAGRRYRPNAKAVITIATTSTTDFVTPRPSRDVQSAQRAPVNHSRQPSRFNLAPQFAQKFEALIVGVSEKQADYISNGG